MIWLMGILKIYLEEQLQMNYYLIKHLLLLKILNMMRVMLLKIKEIAEELLKPIIRKTENIWGADLADMQFKVILKEFIFYCVLLIFKVLLKKLLQLLILFKKF